MAENPIINWYQIKDSEFLKFTFSGKFTKQDSATSVEVWKEHFSSRGHERYNIIWDCIQMTGYEPMARSDWQKAIKKLKSKIGTVWLISDSIVVTTGAQLLSLFVSFNLKVVSSEDEIEA